MQKPKHFYYMEYGTDYFEYINKEFNRQKRQWAKTVKEQKNSRKFAYSTKSEWEKNCVKDFLECVNGLQYMHTLNCPHRDFKVENVVRGLDGHLKLIDFGVTHRFGLWDKECIATDRVGTPGYMSPECYYCENDAAEKTIKLKQYGKYSAKKNDNR
eukprot:UN26542